MSKPGKPVMGDGDPATEQDLGGGVALRTTYYSGPDGTEPMRVVGWILSHPTADGKRCVGSAWTADSPFGSPGHTWTVEAGTPEKPLSLAPSFRCHCGFHGWIRDGRWVSG